MRDEKGRWLPGNTGNPAGRPRTGLAFAEATRERLDPQKVLDLVCRFLDDEQVPLERRLAVLLPYVHAGYMKPPSTSDIRVTDNAALDLSHLSETDLVELLAKLSPPTSVTRNDETEVPTSLTQPSVSEVPDPKFDGLAATVDDVPTGHDRRTLPL